MTINNKKPNTFILMLLISYAAVSAVLFTPAIPQIMKELHTSSTVMEISVVIFLVGYALGQLIYGPLGNRYQRKGTLYIGLSIALAGELISTYSCYQHNIPLLFLGRLITAVGASAGYAVTFAIVTDNHENKTARKVLSLMILSFAIAPGISVLLGGVIAKNMSWESSFYLLMGYGAVLIALIPCLPETCQRVDKTPFNLKQAIAQYAGVLQNKNLVLYGLCCSIWSAFLYVYYSDAPFIATQDFHMRADHYGAIGLITAAGYFLGNIIARLLANTYEAKQVVHFGLAFIFIGIVILGLVSADLLHWHYLFFISIAVCFVGGAMFFSNAIVLGLENVSNIAAATAMFGCINLLGAVFCTAFVSYLGTPHIGTFFIIYASLFAGLVCLNGLTEHQAYERTVASYNH